MRFALLLALFVCWAGSNLLPSGQAALNKRAVQIVVPEGSKFGINMDALKEVLLHPLMATKKVVPVAIAGPFRKGKSFLMNFLLRYLATRTSNGTETVGSDWLNPDLPLYQGFDFREGSKAHTKGIWLYPEPFLMRDQHGEEVAIILLDCQGSWDPETDTKQNSIIFALTALVSSTLIYNVQGNIGQDRLQDLQFFGSYGEMVLNNSQGHQDRPFQSLIFCVRDWQYPNEKQYGFNGGYDLLEQNSQVHGQSSPEIRKLRQDIRERLFTSVRAFLMPYPGSAVAMGEFDHSNLRSIDNEFITQVRVFAEDIFSSQNLKPKMVNGEAVNGRQLIVYFQAYFAAYQGGKMPEPKSIYELTVETNNLAAKQEAMTFYSEQMRQNVTNAADIELDGLTALNNLHHKIRDLAIVQFNSARKMGGDELSRSYRSKLNEEIEDLFHKNIIPMYEAKQNEIKHQREIEARDEQLKGLNDQVSKLSNETEEGRAQIAELTKQMAEAQRERQKAEEAAAAANRELQEEIRRLKEKEGGFWSALGNLLSGFLENAATVIVEGAKAAIEGIFGN